MVQTTVKYFGGSIFLSMIGLLIAGALGYWEYGTLTGFFQAVSIVFALSLLELSISFENAVVNATVLRHMSPLWQKRFLTWGIWIAVFGMRLVCPLLIVCVSAWVDPLTALNIALFDPTRYAEMMTSIHHEVNAFGGAFLAMAALKYFFDAEKDVHWIHVIEAPLARMGKLEAIEIAIVLAVLWLLTRGLPPEHGMSVLAAGVAGLFTFIIVGSLATYLKRTETQGLNRADLGMFLYLEVLDASFSFDGVIGAFAISNHLFYITIGLGVGALFVRSLTVLMVDRGTLEAFKFLEHGAFWAVGSLAALMFTGIHYHVPEAFASTIGIALIGLSIWSSLRARKATKAA